MEDIEAMGITSNETIGDEHSNTPALSEETFQLPPPDAKHFPRSPESNTETLRLLVNRRGRGINQQGASSDMFEILKENMVLDQ